MFGIGIIVPAASAWFLPVMTVTELDGKLRFCVDYRMLNHVNKVDCWIMPKIKDIFGDLQDRNYSAALHVFLGYWQIQIYDSYKEMASFVTRLGEFQFEVRPFKIMNTPKKFQRIVNGLLTGLHIYWEYLHDAAIHSKILTESLLYLDVVFSSI